MNKRIQTVACQAGVALALSLLAACDRESHGDFAAERAGSAYRSAMADYNAGRLEAAEAGFRRICSEEPANASARFQLGCLLQNEGKDYLGAVLAYTEYINQKPSSDKAAIAKSRRDDCERELARVLARRYGLDGSETAVREAEAARKDLSDMQKRTARLDEDLAQAMRRISALNLENARLKEALRGTAGETVTAAGPAGTDPSLLAEARAIQAESSAERSGAVAVSTSAPRDLKEILNEPSSADDSRAENAADIAQLRREEKVERAFGSSLLPEQPADAKVRRAEAEAAAAKARAEAEAKKRPLIQRPETYVIQEGDTLYKIAVRFYGHASAWKGIRNANKATITTDGRVKVGSRIKLP